MNPRHNQAPSKRSLPLAILIPGAFLLCSILFSVMATASISTVGSEIHSLQIKMKALKKQNDLYQVQIAGAQSLESARVFAEQNGFVPIENILTLDKTSTAIARN